MPLEHERVKAFVGNELADQPIFPHELPPVNLKRWVAGGEIEDDGDDEMMDE